MIDTKIEEIGLEAQKKDQLNKKMAKELAYEMNPGRIALGHLKFSANFRRGLTSFLAVSENQYKFGRQSYGRRWAVVSPRGKVLRKTYFATDTTVKDLIYIQQQRAFFIFGSNDQI